MERGKQQEKWAAPLRGSASSTELRSPLTPPGGGAIGAAGMRVPLMPKSTPAICLLQWSACAGAAIVRLLLCGTQPASQCVPKLLRSLVGPDLKESMMVIVQQDESAQTVHCHVASVVLQWR